MTHLSTASSKSNAWDTYLVPDTQRLILSQLDPLTHRLLLLTCKRLWALCATASHLPLISGTTHIGEHIGETIWRMVAKYASAPHLIAWASTLFSYERCWSVEVEQAGASNSTLACALAMRVLMLNARELRGEQERTINKIHVQLAIEGLNCALLVWLKHHAKILHMSSVVFYLTPFVRANREDDIRTLICEGFPIASEDFEHLTPHGNIEFMRWVLANSTAVVTSRAFVRAIRENTTNPIETLKFLTVTSSDGIVTHRVSEIIEALAKRADPAITQWWRDYTVSSFV